MMISLDFPLCVKICFFDQLHLQIQLGLFKTLIDNGSVHSCVSLAAPVTEVCLWRCYLCQMGEHATLSECVLGHS